ncbi:MAG: cell division protein FtsQ/DivIB [Blautia sp.]
MSGRKIIRIIIEAAAAALLIFVLVFFLGFQVTSVKVEGNSFYSDEQIKNMILDVPLAKNSILAGFINTEKETKDASMIEQVSVVRKDRNTLILQVKEKQLVGYIEYQGRCVNFDRQGIIQIITEEPIENIPMIEGINVKEAKQGEKLKGINTGKLNTLLSVGKMLEKMEEKPDRLVFNELNQLVLYYGNIEVRLGDDENMDEKINRMVGILPYLDGLTGILHLENITEDTRSVVFDDTTQDSGDEDGTDTSQDWEYEDSSDSQEEEDNSGQDRGEEEDSSDSSSGSNSSDSRDEGGNSSRSRDEEEDQEEDVPDIEYSDGSDSADTGNR